MTTRLLVLTPRFPYPLYGGDVLRIYQLCETLSQTFRLTLLSICQSPAEMEVKLPADSPFSEVHRVYLPKWRSYVNALTALVTGQSMQTAYYASGEFKRAVELLRGEHDILLCHLARTAPYAQGFDGIKVLELTDYIPLTYARSNAIKGKGLSLRRLIYTLEQERVERAQNALAPEFDLICFVSDLDRAMFLKSSGINADQVVTFGNGVNLHERPFIPHRAGKTVGFIGTLKAMPNADAVAHFVTQVLPLIHRVDPEVKFRAVGAVDDKFRARFEGSHVEFTGSVPELAQAVADCAIGVCPVRMGAGVQNKMLDYMALGMAAVTTTIGAEGLEGRGGGAFVVADEPQSMADAIVALLNDSQRREQMTRQARALMETRYSWAGRLAELPSRILAGGALGQFPGNRQMNSLL